MISSVLSTIIRPNNTTAYTAGDCIGEGGIMSTNTLEKVAATAGGGGYIIGAHLSTDQANIVNGTFRLWLFNQENVTSVSDNSPFEIHIADENAEKGLIGYIDFELETTGQGANLRGIDINHNLNMAFNCSNESLYYVLTATGAYTPTARQKFFIKLLVDQY